MVEISYTNDRLFAIGKIVEIVQSVQVVNWMIGQIADWSIGQLVN